MALALALTLGMVTACREVDPARRVLGHRQSFAVALKSWVPSGGGVVVEIEIVPAFAPRVDTLTVRTVGFDVRGEEIASRRVPLPVKDLPTGLPTVLRQQIDLPPDVQRVGVEVEVMPPPGAWNEIPELAPYPQPASSLRG